ncbi:type I-E CRISPR-associated protein Cas7/Cse4/CasC [Actinomyces lilanjuaniae]|uniref:Type I-E CRISPR-associated protein Cas7/Cse4/CasC n=1 Tax=Actinomyces lilanjuaniae TaxID=2321394 RepID=A0ABN5PP77_9ACTO|nr:type I-E CRISPR-associated protein Cas7/Cse4/CasC [Actinomyces lilanjuaniae]AYD89829.1 type I-E CRISPR-associated protein Cas7/Cse4/CasC [Actinomyces lilanjuaniae]
MALTIDIHALQSLPPSNINRDDTGAPKSAVFGGAVRQRVSSQAWKRAIRKDFDSYLSKADLGTRSKRVVDLVAKRVCLLDESYSRETALKAAEAVFKAAGIKTVEPKVREDEEPRAPETGYLLFLSDRQVEQAARFILDNGGKAPSKKQAKDILDQGHSIDVAMFGRMVADAPDYNVDAAVQVAHAIGVHESEPEFDYFTAVDDEVQRGGEETGAGMIGTIQMMSSTLYRFATIDVLSLRENLGGDSEATLTAASSFLRSFIRSLPTGKITTFANNTLPELVYVTVRDDRPVSLVNAFENPVRGDEGTSRRRAAARALAEEARSVSEVYEMLPLASFIVSLSDLGEEMDGLGERVRLSELLDRVTSVVRQRLSEGSQA